MAITPNTEGKEMITVATDWPASQGPQSWAGYRAHRRNRVTGTTVVLVDGRAADMDTSAGRWSLVCDDHGTACAFTHQRDARAWMQDPSCWCEECDARRYA